MLADVPDDALNAAAKEYLQSTAEWRPVPGKLRARALELAGADAASIAARVWYETGERLDGDMERAAHQRGDQIALDAIKAMRLKVRWHEDKDEAIHNAERERVFVETYARILAARQLFTPLPAGNTASLEAGAYVQASPVHMVREVA